MGGANAYVGFAGSTDGARPEIRNFRYNVTLHGDPFPGMRVTQVFVSGPNLIGSTSDNGLAFYALAGIDTIYGYPVPAGRNQLKSIPWTGGVNRIALRFGGDVGSYLESEDMVIRGSNTPTYVVSNFTYWITTVPSRCSARDAAGRLRQGGPW